MNNKAPNCLWKWHAEVASLKHFHIWGCFLAKFLALLEAYLQGWANGSYKKLSKQNHKQSHPHSYHSENKPGCQFRSLGITQPLIQCQWNETRPTYTRPLQVCMQSHMVKNWTEFCISSFVLEVFNFFIILLFSIGNRSKEQHQLPTWMYNRPLKFHS